MNVARKSIFPILLAATFFFASATRGVSQEATKSGQVICGNHP